MRPIAVMFTSLRVINTSFIGSYQTLATEIRFLDANKPNGEWKIIQPRERGHEYSVSHYDDSFFIRTNWNAKNYKLMKTAVSSPSKESWKELIAHRDDVFLSGIEIFKSFWYYKSAKMG